ncbi:hypothetical protein BDK51DRAFT_29588 [Blyttiomyces helicus]|uniref:Uncharacterized protein n=1 Tax=Blyttiomyces helicus TaxID=388810 RepID=A0A4P9WND1_9FUNG|nr:hypothetical protein BDK51DRAFT_29588 [Blyttiomyces helicus]|eukprot:RKO93583.1 hypothetical protein BDK51DRAFT_29588 [Blyttiomyces helicus]
MTITSLQLYRSRFTTSHSRHSCLSTGMARCVRDANVDTRLLDPDAAQMAWNPFSSMTASRRFQTGWWTRSSGEGGCESQELPGGRDEKFDPFNRRYISFAEGGGGGSDIPNRVGSCRWGRRVGVGSEQIRPGTDRGSEAQLAGPGEDAVIERQPHGRRSSHDANPSRAIVYNRNLLRDWNVGVGPKCTLGVEGVDLSENRRRAARVAVARGVGGWEGQRYRMGQSTFHPKLPIRSPSLYTPAHAASDADAIAGA